VRNQPGRHLRRDLRVGAVSAELDDARLAAWTDFLLAHVVLVDRLEAELQAELGLPLTWYDVLVQLADAPGGELRMQELAAAVLLSKSGLTRLFGRMEQAGLVERRPCLSDQRGAFAALTAAGKDVLERARPVHRRGIAEHFARYLTDDETQALRSAVGKVLAAAAPGRGGAGLPAPAERRFGQVVAFSPADG